MIVKFKADLFTQRLDEEWIVDFLTWGVGQPRKATATPTLAQSNRSKKNRLGLSLQIQAKIQG